MDNYKDFNLTAFLKSNFESVFNGKSLGRIVAQSKI